MIISPDTFALQKKPRSKHGGHTRNKPSLEMREGRGEKRNNTQIQMHIYIGIS